MKAKELKEYFTACNDDLEIKVIRDGDILDTEAHTVQDAYVICKATGDLEYLNAVYLVWYEE